MRESHNTTIKKELVAAINKEGYNRTTIEITEETKQRKKERRRIRN